MIVQCALQLRVGLFLAEHMSLNSNLTFALSAPSISCRQGTLQQLWTDPVALLALCVRAAAPIMHTA